MSLDVSLTNAAGEEVFEYNITHNLNKMADEAGLYDCLWRPEEHGITKASQLIEPIEKGLAVLATDAAKFKTFEPSNGWGDYRGLLLFAVAYLEACKAHPEADVRADR